MAKAEVKVDELVGMIERGEQPPPKLDQAVLSKAFGGELAPQDQGDEPASALQGRLKAVRNTESGARRSGRHPQD